MICQNCEESVRKLVRDPRDPPLDTGPCLCKECYEIAAQDVIDELEGRIEDLRSTLK